MLNKNTLIETINIECETEGIYEHQFDKFPGNPKLEIHMENENGGFIPHFHIVRDNSVILRIRLLENKYQRDSHEKDAGIKLTSKERAALEKWMNIQVKFTPYNNWQMLCFEWNRFNKQREFNPLATKQPNYTDILEP